MAGLGEVRLHVPEGYQAEVPVAGLALCDRVLLTLRAQGVEHVRLAGGARERADLLIRQAARGRKDVPVIGCGPDDGAVLPWFEADRVVSKDWASAVLASSGPARFLSPDGGDTGMAVCGPFGPSADLAAEHLEPPGFSVPVRGSTDRRRAEDVLFASLVKPTDGWVSVHLNRPVSLFLSRRLAPLAVTPNEVTVFTLGVGIASAVVSTLGTFWALALGGVLYQLASVLDGVDGELARIRFQGTPTGQWLDTICDDTTNTVYMVGVALGAWNATGLSALLWTGLAGAAANVVVVGLLYWQLVHRFHAGTLLAVEWDVLDNGGAAPSWGTRLVRAAAPLVKRDSYALAFMLLCLVGLASWIPVLATAGVAGTAVALAVQLRAWRKDGAWGRTVPA